MIIHLINGKDIDANAMAAQFPGEEFPFPFKKTPPKQNQPNRPPHTPGATPRSISEHLKVLRKEAKTLPSSSSSIPTPHAAKDNQRTDTVKRTAGRQKRKASTMDDDDGEEEEEVGDGKAKAKKKKAKVKKNRTNDKKGAASVDVEDKDEKGEVDIKVEIDDDGDGDVEDGDEGA